MICGIVNTKVDQVYGHSGIRVSPNIAFWIVEGIGEASRHSATMRQPSAFTAFMMAVSFGLRATQRHSRAAKK